MTKRTRMEQETIIRYDQDERTLDLYTAWPVDARRWEKLGYPVEVAHRAQDGSPSGWRVVVPLACLRPLRKLANGQVVKRKVAGRPFAPAYNGGSSTHVAPARAETVAS
ncbi:MAG TPA: hypothetical protein QGH10_15820 [Armatimonadota bacterium]|nr:hypothetical protein [Armatimonadota bacterium]